MSVTFSAAPSAVAGFALTCGHENGVTEHRWDAYSDAAEFLMKELDEHGCTGHLAVCGDEYCRSSRMFTHPILVDPSPEVNVSNANAVHLLGLLGVQVEHDGELLGSMSAQDFLGRVLVALAVNPADAGIPVTTSTAPSGMTLVDCGRSEGYADRRLAELRDVAEFAVGHDRLIQWG